MKRILALLLLPVASQLRADLIFHDSFNYAPSSTQISTAGTPTWTLRNSPQIDARINPGSLSYAGLNGANDNSLIFDGTGASGIASRNLGQIYNINNSTTLYYSLTLRVSNITTADWGAAANYLTGSFMMGFSQDASGALANPSVAAPLLIRTGDPNNTTGTANDFQGFQLGTGVTAVSPGARVFDGTRTYNPNETLFLVFSYTFGAAATDDVAKLYVNPAIGSLEGNNTPVVNATGVADVSNNQIQAFFVRNNSVEPASTIIDDLRVGTSWADVTTAIPVPEPSTFILASLGFAGFLVYRFRR